MAGKRILDVAILSGVVRSIARQHLQLRSEQLDLWSKTSSVAKALKSQTDRVTVTAQAASALARRFDDSAPASQHIFQAQRTNDEAVPRKATMNDAEGLRNTDGIKQDHHYERNEQNTVLEPPKDEELKVRQEKPARFPTADGSIPPDDAPIQTIDQKPINPDVVTKRDDVGVQDVVPGQDGKSTIPSASVPPPASSSELTPQQELPEQESVPEGINTDVFHTPRVKKMLGGAASKNKAANAAIHKLDSGASRVTEASSKRDQNVSATRVPDAEMATTSALSQDIRELAADIGAEAQTATAEETIPDTPHQDNASPAYEMRESSVPSSRFGRIWQYSGLATSMAFGAVGESLRRVTGSGSTGPLMLSGKNMDRLVAKLSRMRGAALKLGQMMSFQDSKMLPAPIAEVLQRVQDNADYMPTWQRDRVLATNLGSEWRSLFSSFDDRPLAAASIGQVHCGVLASTGADVAIKIQYPGVADSISSDLNNLSLLLTASRLLPKGLYLDKTIANARTELAWECDYEREATCQERFRTLLASESDIFTVPAIVPEACGKQVLTASFMHGKGVTKIAPTLSQAQRDWIGTQILRLCLRELTEFRFMQTDPNWTNFLYSPKNEKLELLDFGATREFPAKFVDPYVGILMAASKGDRATVQALSVQLGYLTGHESSSMINAHLASVMTLAEPFSESLAAQSGGKDAVYDFHEQTITDRVRAQIPVMLRERLAPPPEETYSLHRKLSGAFLMLARLGSRVRCRDLFVDAIGRWEESGRSAQVVNDV